MGIADLYAGTRPLELPPLGAPWALVDPGVELKPYPSCRFTHRAIDAVLAIRDAAPAGATVESITCESDPFSRNILIYDRATTGLEGKFCMAYCLAVAWLDGHPHLASFSDARAASIDAQALAARVTVSDAASADEVVTIVLTSGETLVRRVRDALGSPANPMTSTQLEAKAARCMAPVIGAEAAAEVAAAVDRLESLPDLGDLIELLATPG